jgi:hypothetical protein
VLYPSFSTLAWQQILNDWNSASNLYTSTFNISLGIIKLEVHDPTCPSSVDEANPWNVPCSSLTLDDRLSVFSKWRAGLGDDGAGLWHLLSGCPTGTEVGIAWLGVLCQSTASQSGNSTVSGAAVSTAGRTEWQVVAHETGHNFGAIVSCTCVVRTLSEVYDSMIAPKDVRRETCAVLSPRASESSCLSLQVRPLKCDADVTPMRRS